jgi:predicted phage-related endonuclease
MAKILPPLHTIESMIDQVMVDSADNIPREHLGCSQIGHPCERWLWLSFRWAVRPSFSGRTLRIFRRGNREERIIASDLENIGIDIRHTGASQKRISFGPHVGGSVDGIIERGVPGAESKRHIAEFKTTNAKNFAKLEKDGVQKAQPTHYAQMQLYMLGTGIDRALYVAVCKDDDRYYTERVSLDKAAAESLRDKALRIVASETMPAPISTDPSWYQCRFCDAHEFCHTTKLTKEVNCRTCAHSSVQEQWHCNRWEDDIPVGHQRKGCDSHVLHPDLVPWQFRQSDDEFDALYVIDGVLTLNGENGYLSKELVANASACAAGLGQVFREEMGGRIVG